MPEATAALPPWEAELPAAQREELLATILARHPDRDPRELVGMMRWDLAEYERPHLPVLVGVLEDRASFGAQRGIRILDMAIRMPHRGWAIPDEYGPFREVIALAVAHERVINPAFDDYYVYLTVDQKIVGPRESQRRPGWHGDAFVSSQTTQLVYEHGLPRTVIVDNTYVVSDTMPTRFLPGPFSLRGVDAEDIPAVLARFEELAAGKEPITFPPYTLVRMTPYDVHAVSVNETDQAIERTFVKIQFSRDKLNMRGNTLNPLFSYDDWLWVPRQPAQRNNRNLISGWDRPDADQFRLVDPGAIDFSAEAPGLPWLEPRFVHAMKTQGVWAEPARAGELLEGIVHGEPITFNIAQAGDWKITTSQGDSYFLGAAKFARRYQPQPTAEGWYLPIPVTTKMAITREPIRFRAEWGAWQYVPAGSAVVRLGGEVYAIHRANFEASYTVVRAPGRMRPRPPPLQPHQGFIDLVVERDGENGFAFFGAPPPAVGRLGVFTVTANPLHLGHVAVATQVARKAGLDGVVIVLAKRHVTKGGHLEATVAERLAMLEAAFDPAAGFYLAVSARGFYRDFVASLAARAPGVERHLMFGIDSLKRYVVGTEASEVEALIGGVARVLVSFREPAGERRRDDLIAACRAKLSAAAVAKIEAVPVDDSGLSSTAIRALIGRGGSWTGAVPPGVAEIIWRRQIYGSAEGPDAGRSR